MIDIEVFPANRGEFEDMKIFCKEILDSFLPGGITPIAYGSLALFGHTKNKETLINDLNLLVNGQEFEKIVKLLKESAIDYEYFEDEQSIVLKEKDSVIQIDSVDHWFKGVDLTFVDMNFRGLELRCLGRKSLMKIYRIASRRDPTRADEFTEKLAMLKGS